MAHNRAEENPKNQAHQNPEPTVPSSPTRAGRLRRKFQGLASSMEETENIKRLPAKLSWYETP